MKSENENLLMNLTFCSTNFESLRYICSVFQFNSKFVSSNKSYEIDWDIKNLKNEINNQANALKNFQNVTKEMVKIFYW